MKKWLFKLLFWIEKKLLDNSDLVSTISYGMISKLESKTDTPYYFFPNWVDENFINPETTVEHKLMNSTKFKILYSGNIGAKQDWDFFIRVVKHFEKRDDVEFVVVGAGAKKEWLVEETKVLSNVKHHMPVEYATLPDLLCSADMHILFQKNDVVDTVMPSKLLGMMASATPSVVTGSVESEVAKVFTKSKGGYFFDSEQFDEVIQSIESLIDKDIDAKQMGADARSYIVEHFSAAKVLENFEHKVNEIIGA